jgi:hypothetical protein
MGTPSQNSVIFEKYFFGQKKILKNYKNWMILQGHGCSCIHRVKQEFLTHIK